MEFCIYRQATAAGVDAFSWCQQAVLVARQRSAGGTVSLVQSGVTVSAQ